MSFDDVAGQLARAGKEFYDRGWVMGTAGNFSSVVSRDPFSVAITASGNDKGALTTSNFLALDADGQILHGDGRPSAETSIHLVIYRQCANAGAVLHTHSVWGTILSDVHFADGAIAIEGYEMLKGLAGVTTHEHRELVPIVANSQDYAALSGEISRVLADNPTCHGIYLHQHGLYTWGADLAEARRHIEIFEFLFEVLGRRLSIR